MKKGEWLRSLRRMYAHEGAIWHRHLATQTEQVVDRDERRRRRASPPLAVLH
ncbi:hypothetical protein [Streptomyces sp. NPDC056525]|uniref:hypothetical protein n=1 Tax=unclassified Streptomyces TaxID=2593676 RepID=UPI00369F4771